MKLGTKFKQTKKRQLSSIEIKVHGRTKKFFKHFSLLCNSPSLSFLLTTVFLRLHYYFYWNWERSQQTQVFKIFFLVASIWDAG